MRHAQHVAPHCGVDYEHFAQRLVGVGRHERQFYVFGLFSVFFFYLFFHFLRGEAVHVGLHSEFWVVEVVAGSGFSECGAENHRYLKVYIYRTIGDYGFRKHVAVYDRGQFDAVQPCLTAELGPCPFNCAGRGVPQAVERQSGKLLRGVCSGFLECEGRYPLCRFTRLVKSLQHSALHYRFVV